MPLISVIVPVYKCEEYLESCVDSILNQTFTDFEIILVDDGSPDNCGKICDDLAQKHKKITVLHQKNQGQAAARNNGIKLAHSEWIHFVDSDDLIHPQMLEILYGAVNETTQISMCGLFKGNNLSESFFSPISVCNFKKYTINEEELILIYHEDYQCWIACAKLIKKDIIEKHLFTQGRIYEDNAVVFKWINEAKNVTITDKPLYFYRTNSHSTTNQDFSLKNLDLLWALEEQIAYYKKKKYKKVLSLICTRYAVHCADFYNKVTNELKLQNEASMLKKKLKKHIKENKNYINLENWEFNLVYGVLYSKPIRVLYRLIRFIKNIKK